RPASTRSAGAGAGAGAAGVRGPADSERSPFTSAARPSPLADQRLRVGDDLLEHLGRAQDPGHAGAGVGAGADQVQAIDLLALVVRAKVGALYQHRLDPEGRALDREQLVLEALRIE